MFVPRLIGKKHFPESITRPRIKKHFPKYKTRPRIQKHVPESKTLPRIQKHVPESKTLPRIQKCFGEGFLKVFLVFGTFFGLSQGFLDSRIEVFWILGSVSDSGTCFGF